VQLNPPDNSARTCTGSDNLMIAQASSSPTIIQSRFGSVRFCRHIAFRLVKKMLLNEKFPFLIIADARRKAFVGRAE
jgi:hypothetical protein